ncbi:MAG: hypothetical protein GX613_15820 [Chloroflexi bacterium]|nr:hypothetical protein [Chloroflexota bacterium]
MDFLKRLFGGGDRGGDKDGLYIYVRSDQTGEVIQVRIHRYNDLSLDEEGEGYHVRKVIVGEKSFDRIEAYLRFDKKRQLVEAQIAGGERVDEAAYEAYRAQRAQNTTT